MKSWIYFFLLLSFWACKTDEVKLPEVSEIPEEAEVPEEPKGASPSFPVLPQPVNPSGQTLVLKVLSKGISYGFPLVDTTVYQYNTNGEVIAEFSTNAREGKQGGSYLRTKKYYAYPENLNIPDKIYAYTTGYPAGNEEFLYCDDQKRVIKARKDVITAFYEYDHKGRLSRVTESHAKSTWITTYNYFDRSETGLAYDYYTVESPYEKATYILSNTLKARVPVNYVYNYGKGPEYVVERKITNGLEISYNYQLNDHNGIVEKNYTSGQYDLWTRYFY